MSPSYWGPATWNFFHTLAAKVKDEEYPTIGPQIFSLIRDICSNLPCPDCSEHAKRFVSNVNISTLKTKQDLINVLYVFHSVVNKRKGKPVYKFENINSYNNNNIIEAFNNFSKVYNTNGNMRLMAEAFHRRRTLFNVKNWVMQNYSKFEK